MLLLPAPRPRPDRGLEVPDFFDFVAPLRRVRFPPPPPILPTESVGYETDLLLEEHWRNIDAQEPPPRDRPAERILGRLMASTRAWSASFA